MDEHKRAEQALFRGAPESARKLHREAKKLIRAQKRREWYNHHKDKGNQHEG
jgi:hypothetical protein